jgi:hypothetical protein
MGITELLIFCCGFMLILFVTALAVIGVLWLTQRSTHRREYNEDK